MNYVVFDLEWNQPCAPELTVREPVVLKGEIIQIGAVKMDDSLNIVSHFSTIVRPCRYTRLHWHIKKMIQFDKTAMMNGTPFERALEEFLEWCGEDCCMLTWGYDDMPMLRDNMALHSIPTEGLPPSYNAQVIFNAQEKDGEKNQCSLAAAMEHFGIEESSAAHDAYNDALHTAMICQRLDIAAGIENYGRSDPAGAIDINTLNGPFTPKDPFRFALMGFKNKTSAMRDERVNDMKCPHCGAEMTRRGWRWQNSYKSVDVVTCPEHGEFLLSVRYSCDRTTGGMRIVRTLRPMDEELQTVYEACEGRRRKKNRRRNENRKRNRAAKRNRNRRKKDAETAAQTAASAGSDITGGTL